MFCDGMCPVSHKIDGRRMRTYVHGDMFPMHKFLCWLHETKMCVRGGGVAYACALCSPLRLGPVGLGVYLVAGPHCDELLSVC